MTRIDLQVLSAQLIALCEVFDRKPVSLKAMEVWFDVLKEFPTEKTMSVLIGWPKSHNKFPSPSEVWKVVNDICIRDREHKAEVEKKEEFFAGVGGAKAREFIESIRKTLNKPSWTPTEHWRRVYETAEKNSIGYRWAEEILKKKQAFRQREPGCDDEEKAVNF